MFIVFISFSTSCKFENTSAIVQNSTINTKEVAQDGLILFQQKCYVCHSVTSKSHDEIIAPPMEAVKRRYKMAYPNEVEFIDAFTNWVMDPTEEHALMRGAVANFKVMPKQEFNREEIIKIAHFIYNNEIEKPEWFQNHFNKEHPNGMGNGMGRGAGGRKF
jgi:cytochrome c551/c552